jgi:hypothetical protein
MTREIQDLQDLSALRHSYLLPHSIDKLAQSRPKDLAMLKFVPAAHATVEPSNYAIMSTNCIERILFLLHLALDNDITTMVNQAASMAYQNSIYLPILVVSLGVIPVGT